MWRIWKLSDARNFFHRDFFFSFSSLTDLKYGANIWAGALTKSYQFFFVPNWKNNSDQMYTGTGVRDTIASVGIMWVLLSTALRPLGPFKHCHIGRFEGVLNWGPTMPRHARLSDSGGGFSHPGVSALWKQWVMEVASSRGTSTFFFLLRKFFLCVRFFCIRTFFFYVRFVFTRTFFFIRTVFCWLVA